MDRKFTSIASMVRATLDSQARWSGSVPCATSATSRVPSVEIALSNAVSWRVEIQHVQHGGVHLTSAANAQVVRDRRESIGVAAQAERGVAPLSA